jgi:hypothetical protein
MYKYKYIFIYDIIYCLHCHPPLCHALICLGTNIHIYGVYTVFLDSSNIRSYTVRIQLWPTLRTVHAWQRQFMVLVGWSTIGRLVHVLNNELAGQVLVSAQLVVVGSETCVADLKGCWPEPYIRIYATSMTVHLLISLPKLPYIHRIYV